MHAKLARGRFPVRPPSVLGAMMGVVLLVRPLAYGISLPATFYFWVLVLATVLLGVLICRAAGLYRDDPLLLWGQGGALGLCLHGLSFVAGRALSAPWLAPVFLLLLAVAALAVIDRREKSLTRSPVPLPSFPALLLLIGLVACLLQPLFSLRLLGEPLPLDLLFHAGNAAELRHRWPLQDPRVSGLPLNYHILAYALPVGASGWIGLPVGDTLLTLAPLFWIALLVLQLYNAGRVLVGEEMAGVLGAAVVVLHVDPGRLLGLGPGAFNSYLSTGLYGSPTTVSGFILLASLTISLSEVLETSSVGPRSLVTLVPLGVAAAATKVSVVPPILGGLGLVTLLALVRRRGPGRAAFTAACVLSLCALPSLLSLTAGESSYRTILRWGPGSVVWSSPFVVGVSEALVRLGVTSGAQPGDLPLLALALVMAAWSLGYFSLGGAGAAAFLWLRRAPLSPSLVWVLGVAASGAAIGLLLQGQGMSQLFFLYDGQALLALLAGAGLVSVWRIRPRPRWLLGVLLGFSLPSLHGAGVGLASALARDGQARGRTYSGFEGPYAAGLAWLRAHATQHTVIFADNPSFLLSAFGECPTFYESGLFTPEGWRKRWEGAVEPYPQKVLLQERFLRRPSRETVDAAARLFPPGTLLRVVADNVQSRVNQGTLEVQLGGVPGRVLFPPELFRLEFANAAMQVYRLEAAP